ncbi:conserved hypothetical protein [Coccidioides posadasii str. Silveira]|uniref:Uncharacterized protein n=1 Tax=Coccidioides posadasii (strain RMSCC 757 / Silveira) TaxID=443226 RepID=E9D6U0_COCPS|nr:conserved hypothetical protein [Coccidioides posadasii str. Silveira]
MFGIVTLNGAAPCGMTKDSSSGKPPYLYTHFNLSLSLRPRGTRPNTPLNLRSYPQKAMLLLWSAKHAILSCQGMSRRKVARVKEWIVEGRVILHTGVLLRPTQ